MNPRSSAMTRACSPKSRRQSRRYSRMSRWISYPYQRVARKYAIAIIPLAAAKRLREKAET